MIYHLIKIYYHYLTNWHFLFTFHFLHVINICAHNILTERAIWVCEQQVAVWFNSWCLCLSGQLNVVYFAVICNPSHLFNIYQRIVHQSAGCWSFCDGYITLIMQRKLYIFLLLYDIITFLSENKIKFLFIFSMKLRLLVSQSMYSKKTYFYGLASAFIV